MSNHITIPIDVAEAASQAIGNFVMDHGWSDSDMQAMDNLDAYIARHKANQSALSAPATAPDELQRLRAESEERLQNCAALIAENERLRRDAESKEWTIKDALAQLRLGDISDAECTLAFALEKGTP